MKTIHFVPVVILLLAGCSKSDNSSAPGSTASAAEPAVTAAKVGPAAARTPAAESTTSPSAAADSATSASSSKTPEVSAPAAAAPAGTTSSARPVLVSASDQGATATPVPAAPAQAHSPVLTTNAQTALEQAAGSLSARLEGSSNRFLGRIVGMVTNWGASNSTALTTNATTGTSANPPATAVSVGNLPSDLIASGLKEALAKGLTQAIARLGKDGGFLTNVNVRIPMPEKLQLVEKTLRRLGQDQMADEFVATMNRAAEKAVPAAAGVFSDSLKQMTVEDARGILQGPKDAATQYFRRTAGPQLQEKFRPIVAQATGETGVTAAYKKLLDRASFASAFLKQESLDLDDYVTTKTMDGLFKTVADEEKRIRENPVARTTDLLRSVFGALGR